MQTDRRTDGRTDVRTSGRTGGRGQAGSSGVSRVGIRGFPKLANLSGWSMSVPVLYQNPDLKKILAGGGGFPGNKKTLDTPLGRQAGRQTDRQAYIERRIERDIQTDIQTYRQTDRERERKRER